MLSQYNFPLFQILFQICRSVELRHDTLLKVEDILYIFHTLDHSSSDGVREATRRRR